MAHQQLLLLFVGELKRFTIPFGMKTPQILIFPGGWSLKDPLLLFVAVVRFPAGRLCLLHLSRWAGSAECCDCRAGREMSRQPLSSSLMPVQVRNVFIAECTVCVRTCVPGKVSESEDNASQLQPRLELQPCSGIGKLQRIH